MGNHRMTKHYQYYWKILDGIDFTMCYDKDWFDNKVRAYLTDRMNPNKDTGGVFMPTENSNTNGILEDIANNWQKEFPLANIVWLDAETAKGFSGLKEHLQIDDWTDIDLLITSPVWSAGIDIQNKFDLTAGLFNLNPKRINDGEALFNFLTRERYPKEIITLFNRSGIGTHWDWYEKIFSTPLNQKQQYSQIITYINANQKDNLPFTANEHFKTDDYGRFPEPKIECIDFIKGLTDVAKDNTLSKAFSLQKLPEIAKHYGANVNTIHTIKDETFYQYILNENYKIYNLNKPDGQHYLRDLKTDIHRTLKRIPRTIQDIYRFKSLSRRPEKEIIKEIKELIGNEMIITNPQFILSKAYIKLTEHKERYDALLTDNNWEAIDLNEVIFAPIAYLEQLLLAVGVEAKLEREDTTRRAELLTKLINKETAEHLTDFKRWKKDYGADFKAKHKDIKHPVFNGNIQSLTYPLYLWNGLNNGIFTFDDLGEFTKKYIHTFDRVIIEGGTIE